MERDVLVRLRRLLDDPEPGRRTLIAALFAHESAVAERAVAGVLDPADIDRLIGLGLLGRVEGGYAPLARLDRAGRLVIASDLRGRRRERDFVVQPGPASFLLGRFVRSPAGGRALDLGCGSGIQALRLAEAGASVTALDVNPRALGFLRFNAALNGIRTIEPLLGDFLRDEPDRELDGGFDVVVANPPFVLSPRLELTYRDRPLPRDDVTRRTIERAARALAPGGHGYVLGNWIDDGGRWSDPVRRWVGDLGLPATVIRVADHSAATYAAVWTKDVAADARGEAAAAWAAALEAEGIRRVHVGVIALARPAVPSMGPARFEAVDRIAA